MSNIPEPDPDFLDDYPNTPEPDPDFLDDYPEGNYVVATGSVASGFEFWGLFSTMREAVEFCEKRQPLMGFCTVVSVKSPDQHPVHPGEDDDGVLS